MLLKIRRRVQDQIDDSERMLIKEKDETFKILNLFWLLALEVLLFIISIPFFINPQFPARFNSIAQRDKRGAICESYQEFKHARFLTLSNILAVLGICFLILVFSFSGVLDPAKAEVLKETLPKMLLILFPAAIFFTAISHSMQKLLDNLKEA